MTDQVFTARDLVLTVAPTEHGGVQNTANVTVDWCLSPRLRDFVANELADKSPSILLAVTTDNRTRRQQYKVVPIDEGRAYLSFRRSGINTVHATLVWQAIGEPSPARAIKNIGYALEEFRPGLAELEAESADLRFTLFGDFEPKLDEKARIHERLEAISNEMNALLMQPHKYRINTVNYDFRALEFESMQDVDVPPGMFGKKPKGLRKWLAEFGGFDSEYDQCANRGHVIKGVAKLIGLTLVSPFIAFVWLMVKLFDLAAIALLVFFGKRDINFDPLLSWRFINPAEIWADLAPSWWLTKREVPDADYVYIVSYPPRHWVFRCILNLPVLTALAAVVWLVVTFLGSEVLLLLMYAVIGLLAGGATYAFLSRSRQLKSAERKQREEAERKTRLERNLAALTCSTAGEVGNRFVTDAPEPTRTTLRLVKGRLKSRVCLPYEQD